MPVEQLHLPPGTTPQRETSLAPDELILHIRAPAGSLGRASTYDKIRDREPYAFSLTSAAALRLQGDVVREARIAPWILESRVGRRRLRSAAARFRRTTWPST